ncbi:MAG: ClpX C4-type zinc finger protein [Planctomycetota bacterium]
MRREGADEENLAMEDFLCDFCGKPWTEDRPMVEGHRGSCICGPCLTVAWTELLIAESGSDLAPGETCTLCLEESEGAVWRSPMSNATACKRCVKQSAGVLHKDRDIAWTKPGAGSPASTSPEA